MSDDAIELIKQQLDAELASRPDARGIGFGQSLFREFLKRGWIQYTQLEYTVPAPGLLWPMYSKQYFASAWPQFPTLEYRLPHQESEHADA